jgi:hypothetical protein
MTNSLRRQLSAGLSLLILFALIQIHFLGDPCLLHGEHTAQSQQSTLSCRTMSCLCFFHAFYAPVEAPQSAAMQASAPAEEKPLDCPIRLLAFDIFHPPRA